jgi:hypothetical protein
MTVRKAKASGVPEFASEEEEAAFWDAHSPLDYPEYWGDPEQVSVERPLGHVLGVRLDARSIDRLAAIGRQQGVGPSTLARRWLLERLAELDDREQASTPTARKAP